MSVLSHDFDAAGEVAAPPELDLQLPLGADFETTWQAIHRDAAQIAAFAQLAAEKPSPRVTGFAERASTALPWNRALATRALDDLAAVLAPGLLALRLIEAEGRDPTAPALALWQEFHRSRAALLDLVEPRVEVDAD